MPRRSSEPKTSGRPREPVCSRLRKAECQGKGCQWRGKRCAAPGACPPGLGPTRCAATPGCVFAPDLGCHARGRPPARARQWACHAVGADPGRCRASLSHREPYHTCPNLRHGSATHQQCVDSRRQQAAALGWSDDALHEWETDDIPGTTRQEYEYARARALADRLRQQARRSDRRRRKLDGDWDDRLEDEENEPGYAWREW